jgi:hypothetical protein
MRTLIVLGFIFGLLAILGVHIKANAQYIFVPHNRRNPLPKDEKCDEKLTSYTGYNAPGHLRPPSAAQQVGFEDCAKIIPFLDAKRALHYSGGNPGIC